MEHRFDELRKRFSALGVANFLVTRLANIRWLCGFTGSNALLLVTRRDAYFITDGRYTTQASRQVSGAKVFVYSGGKSAADGFVRELKENPEIKFRGRIGIESDILSVDFHKLLSAELPGSRLVDTRNVVDDLGMVKEEAEIAAIRRAVAITDKVFREIVPLIKPGVRERDIAAEISYRHKLHGAEKDGFDSIVASGPRSALPHGIASTRRIKQGDFVTLDFGCVHNGYPSDMTRTVVVGKASTEQKKVYNAVKDAQQRAIEAVKPGVRCRDIDAVARKIIKDAGYGRYFNHGLGHGLGLWDRVREVHSRPVLSPQSRDRAALGMVFTIEPGVYIERFGGVRIEDDVVVTGEGCQVLNRSPKRLMEL